MAEPHGILQRYTENLAAGTLQWIGFRPERRADMVVVNNVQAVAELGLEGDRRCRGTPGSGRQLTLISQEHIAVIAAILGRDNIPRRFCGAIWLCPVSISMYCVINGFALVVLSLKLQPIAIPVIVWKKSLDRVVLPPCWAMVASVPKSLFPAILR